MVKEPIVPNPYIWEHVAIPELLIGTELQPAIATPPDKNSTVPVGTVPEPVTVAVYVTDTGEPGNGVIGFAEEAIVVLEPASV